MSLFGAKLDWKISVWLSTRAVQPFPLYIVSITLPCSNDFLTKSCFSLCRICSCWLRSCPCGCESSFYLPAGTEASVLAFTSNPLLVDTDVLLESRLVPQSEMSRYSGLEKLRVFERLVVARTAITWRTADGSVWLQIANPSSRGVKIPKGFALAF